MIIGITGVTNGGKSSLTKLLLKEYSNSVSICQDDFFFSTTSGRLKFIEELNSFDYDCLEAVDSERFKTSLDDLINKSANSIIFVDGFLLFYYKEIKFDKKYFLTLTQQECLNKRLNRNYKTVGSIEYFQNRVWPCYTSYYNYCEKKFNDIVYLNGNHPIDQTFSFVKKQLDNLGSMF